MSKKLPTVSGRQTVKALVKLGFTVRTGKGDHVVFEKGSSCILGSEHKTLKKGTLRKILKIADITVEDFNEML